MAFRPANEPSNFSDTPDDAETPTVSPPSDGKHTHQNEAISEEISRQADEILARLNKVSKPTEMDQEEQILADIQSQQREVADSHLLNESEPSPASLPIPTPELHQDDSEMLVVDTESHSADEVIEPETLPMTDSPVSSGRASRMDYEQLFDRLRNLPETDPQ